MIRHELFLILDFGGRGGESLARRIRGLGVYSEILPCAAPAEKIKASSPRGIALCGSVDGFDANNISREIIRFSETKPAGVPVICVGADIYTACKNCGFAPDTFAETENDIIKFNNFLYNTCKFDGDWKMRDFIDDTIDALCERIGDGKALLALSGGVDSTVCAALLNRAIGRRLTCIFVDHGLLRKNEADSVEAVCAKMFDAEFIRIDASARFLARLAGISDPEQKRKIVGEEFIRVFEEEAKKIGKIDFFVQGTIYPDVVESGVGGAALVKTHHNVGGLPEKMGFSNIIEPLRSLFKNEVRQIGADLGLPDEITFRQPFPGPGLSVRVIGEVTAEKISILREADAIFREELDAAGISRDISEYFAVLTDMRSVGVSGGARSYGRVVALRAIRSNDFMTAGYVRLPYDVLDRACSRITANVPGVSRVVYDVTPKPPSTIEWE